MDNKIHVPNHQPAIILFCRGKKKYGNHAMVPGLLSGNPQPVPQGPQFSLRPHGQRLGRDRAITLRLGAPVRQHPTAFGELPEPGTRWSIFAAAQEQ